MIDSSVVDAEKSENYFNTEIFENSFYNTLKSKFSTVNYDFRVSNYSSLEKKSKVFVYPKGRD